ncbi:MAG: Gfo/Idh/MocA family oxidoreductase [Eubacteriales bacterium]
MLKIAIVGLGTVSAIHKSAINASELGKLVAVCDIDPRKKADLPSEVSFYTDLKEMLIHEELDCVHICLPHYLHTCAIELCATYGRHVFTEKPLALTEKEGKTILHLEDKYAVKIGVCFQNRYNDTIVHLKNLLENDNYGKLICSKGIVTWCREMSYYQEATWRGEKDKSGGGVMINQAIHTLDLLSYLGGEFDSLEGKVANFALKETEIEDSVMCRLDYQKGGTCIFFATIAYGDNSEVELEFVYEKAKFSIHNHNLYKTEGNTTVSLAVDQTLEGGKEYYGASHGIAVKKFYQAILANNLDYISMSEGLYAIKVMDAIFASSSENMNKIIL